VTTTFSGPKVGKIVLLSLFFQFGKKFIHNKKLEIEL